MDEFLKYQQEIADIQYTINLLMWELRIVAPKDSQNNLVDLIAYHEKNVFQLQTSEHYGELLNNAINCDQFKNLEESEKRYIYNLLKHYEDYKKIPLDFYEEYSKLKNKANLIWKEAKDNNDYKLFEPFLEKLVQMTKKYYSYIDSDADNLYDAMLNEYEIGVKSELIDKLFAELKTEILPLIPFEQNDNKKLSIDYTEEELINCAKYLLNYIGFDLNRGTIGIYPHGYTEKMNYNDIRIAFSKTTDPISFVATIIHEGGHGIFEQNIKPNLSKYENTTLANLFGLHESQSRFFENILGRNKNFWIPIYDDVKRLLRLDLSLDEFVKLLNTPKCGAIRTKADELTYCMHIILRYEIEKDLFNGTIKVSDIPKIWNDKMLKYLNVLVKNDSEGLMQDVHWSEGSFGYFPSYLLGSIYDGMFKEAIEKDLGNIDELLKNGNIKKITQYLIDNIYKNGGAYTSLEIINKMCGEEISAKPLIDYFNKKYGN